MGVKWTPELDQILLVKLLELRDFHLRGADVEAIKNAWRKPFDRTLFKKLTRTLTPYQAKAKPTPTARAISEHLVVLKKQVDGGNALTLMSSTSSQTTVNTASRAKNNTKAKPRSDLELNATLKRQRTEVDDDEEIPEQEDARNCPSMTPGPRNKCVAPTRRIKKAEPVYDDEEALLASIIKKEAMEEHSDEIIELFKPVAGGISDDEM